MDFDLHFGRFFGSQIDFFGKAASSENVPPKEIWTPKKRDFPQGKRYFLQNARFCFEVEIDEKHEQKRKKIASKYFLFSTSILKGFWSQLGFVLAPKLTLKRITPLDTFSCCVQEASRRRPRGVQERPRASQERPKSAQERPKSAQERPKSVHERPESDQNVPRGRSRCHRRNFSVHVFVF